MLPLCTALCASQLSLRTRVRAAGSRAGRNAACGGMRHISHDKTEKKMAEPQTVPQNGTAGH
jgi:hypothetical protein